MRPLTLVIAASTIAQQAFRLMELAPISSFADTSPEAAAAKEQYGPALDRCLAAVDWSFARRLVSLAPATLPDTEAVDPDLNGVFEVPGDLVALRKVYDDTRLWRRDGRYIRAGGADNLLVLYTQRIENEALLPATFQTFVSYELAVRVGHRYTTTRTKLETLKNDRTEAFRVAAQADALSAQERAAALDDWARDAVL